MFETLETISQFVSTHPFIATTILVALIFDFINGFHDSANAIATVVATKVLSPIQAVAMAGFFNFLGPFVFSLAVATTIGKGILNTTVIDPAMLPGIVFAALVGASVWDLVTWWTGLPTSSSHALVGGMVGAGIAALGTEGIIMPKLMEFAEVAKFAGAGAVGGLLSGLVMTQFSRLKLPKVMMWIMSALGLLFFCYLHLQKHGMVPHGDAKESLEWTLNLFTMAFMGATIGAVAWASTQREMPRSLLGGFTFAGACLAIIIATLLKKLVLGGITKTLVFMIVSPFLGFLAGFLLAIVVAWVARDADPRKTAAWSRKLQLASSAFYALNHGTNDAQKTMGVIVVLLIAAGAIQVDPNAPLHIPNWVIESSALAIGLGTLFGGWRIVKTLANRLGHLRPAQGFAAETGGGVVLHAMAAAGIPVSTTHAITSSIMGVGATRRTSAVRWDVGRRIVGAWILTIPASAAVSWITYEIYRLFV